MVYRAQFDSGIKGPKLKFFPKDSFLKASNGLAKVAKPLAWKFVSTTNGLLGHWSLIKGVSNWGAIRTAHPGLFKSNGFQSLFMGQINPRC